jgi:soluble lytic murein transglycosylase-like protein
MRSRLFALLLVAALSGVGAAASARQVEPAPKRTVRAPRLPALPGSEAVHPAVCPLPRRFRAAFVRAARDTNLQLAMLVAVAEVESRFQPDARSRADARGLLQVLPSTAASLHLDVDDPSSNVLAGARYLKQLFARYQSTDTAFAAYNAGPTAVDRAGGIAPTRETETYVANVQARWHALAGCR